ncbi:thiopurine S-methyltransferase-like [Halichondria panicea]|uniref:thiopurine S-methyltransferase-like n=1 Tax=Halichondria panicea TaxID=6063 RepID=UPI00312B8E98
MTTLSPNFWNYQYKEGKDEWTSTTVDGTILKNFEHLHEASKLNILLPMCGKTGLLLSLADKGHKVVGIEWAELAIVQFFEEHGLAYVKKEDKDVTVYSAKNKDITLYCCDILLFNRLAGSFDLVIDHGSIGCVECKQEKRSSYAKIITSFLKPGGRIIFSFFDYIHSEHPSIPYAVTEDEVRLMYSEDSFKPLTLLQEIDVKEAMELFSVKEEDDVHFPLWELSRYSWKIVLLTKK